MASTGHNRFNLVFIGLVLGLAWWIGEGLLHTLVFGEPVGQAILPHDANETWMRLLTAGLLVLFGWYAERSLRQLERVELARLEAEQKLSEALSKALSGFIPICSHCQAVRNEEEQWTSLQRYIGSRTEAIFSHGICPICVQEHYAEYVDDLDPDGPAASDPAA